MKTKTKNLDNLISRLPKYSYSLTHKQMEPINLIIIGKQHELVKHFKLHGWYIPNKQGFVSFGRALLSVLFNRSYHNGPMSSSYLKGRHFDLGFEKPTGSDTLRRRHHLRLWRANYSYRGRRVWAGTISYDRAAGLSSNHLIPTHHIAPTLSWEESFLAHSLGIAQPAYVRISEPESGYTNTGDDYKYDGRAIVIDLARLD